VFGFAASWSSWMSRSGLAGKPGVSPQRFAARVREFQNALPREGHGDGGNGVAFRLSTYL
jgi:hypothetical protein